MTHKRLFAVVAIVFGVVCYLCIKHVWKTQEIVIQQSVLGTQLKVTLHLTQAQLQVRDEYEQLIKSQCDAVSQLYDVNQTESHISQINAATPMEHIELSEPEQNFYKKIEAIRNETQGKFDLVRYKNATEEQTISDWRIEQESFVKTRAGFTVDVQLLAIANLIDRIANALEIKEAADYRLETTSGISMLRCKSTAMFALSILPESDRYDSSPSQIQLNALSVVELPCEMCSLCHDVRLQNANGFPKHAVAVVNASCFYAALHACSLCALDEMESAAWSDSHHLQSLTLWQSSTDDAQVKISSEFPVLRTR